MTISTPPIAASLFSSVKSCIEEIQPYAKDNFEALSSQEKQRLHEAKVYLSKLESANHEEAYTLLSLIPSRFNPKLPYALSLDLIKKAHQQKRLLSKGEMFLIATNKKQELVTNPEVEKYLSFFLDNADDQQIKDLLSTVGSSVLSKALQVHLNNSSRLVKTGTHNPAYLINYYQTISQNITEMVNYDYEKNKEVFDTLCPSLPDVTLSNLIRTGFYRQSATKATKTYLLNLLAKKITYEVEKNKNIPAGYTTIATTACVLDESFRKKIGFPSSPTAQELLTLLALKKSDSIKEDEKISFHYNKLQEVLISNTSDVRDKLDTLIDSIIKTPELYDLMIKDVQVEYAWRKVQVNFCLTLYIKQEFALALILDMKTPIKLDSQSKFDATFNYVKQYAKMKTMQSSLGNREYFVKFCDLFLSTLWPQYSKEETDYAIKKLYNFISQKSVQEEIRSLIEKVQLNTTLPSGNKEDAKKFKL